MRSFSLIEGRRTVMGTDIRRSVGTAVNSLILFFFSFFFLGLCEPIVAVLLLLLAAGFIFSVFKGTPVFMRTVTLCVMLLLFTSAQLTSFILTSVLFVALAAVFLRFGDAARYAILCTLCLASGAVIYLLTDYIIYGLTPLIALCAAIALAVSQKRHLPRSYAVALVSVAVIIPLVIAFLVGAYVSNGGLNGDVLREVIDGYRAELITALTELDAKDYFPIEESMKPFTPELAAQVVTALFNVMIGIVVTAIFLLAYAANNFALNLTIAFGRRDVLEPEDVRFRTSAVSGAVFFLALAVNLFASFGSSQNAELIAYGAMNLYTVLLPGMLMTALTYFKEKASKDGAIRISIFTVIFIAAALFLFTSVAIALFACYGAVGTLLEEIRASRPANGQNDGR